MTTLPIIPLNEELSEQEAALAVEAYLPTCAYGEASYDDLIFNLPGKYLALRPEHRDMQRVRNEQKWVAALRNISAHHNKPGNAIYEGRLVKRRGGGFQLASRAKEEQAKKEKANGSSKTSEHEQRGADPGPRQLCDKPHRTGAG
jgi:hypothetical protein